MDEILDSQEFRRELVGPGDVVGDLEKLPFTGCTLSVELDFANPGLCGICFGADGISFGCREPFGVAVGFVAGFVLFTSFGGLPAATLACPGLSVTHSGQYRLTDQEELDILSSSGGAGFPGNPSRPPHLSTYLCCACCESTRHQFREHSP